MAFVSADDGTVGSSTNPLTYPEGVGLSVCGVGHGRRGYQPETISLRHTPADETTTSRQ